VATGRERRPGRHEDSCTERGAPSQSAQNHKLLGTDAIETMVKAVSRHVTAVAASPAIC
jgi:hypothetical protein